MSRARLSWRRRSRSSSKPRSSRFLRDSASRAPPRVDARDDAGLRGQAVPARGADLGVLAEEALPGDACGRQELHDRAALEVPAHEAEQQAEALGRRVDARLALHEVRRDPRPLEGRRERRRVAGRVAEEDGRLARPRAGCGRLLHEPRDLHRLHRLARRRRGRGRSRRGACRRRWGCGARTGAAGGAGATSRLSRLFRLRPARRAARGTRAGAVVPRREGQRASFGDHGERVVLAQGDQEVRSHWGHVVEAEKDDTTDRAARERLRREAVDRGPVEEPRLLEAKGEVPRGAGQQAQALRVGRAGRQPLEVLRPEEQPPRSCSVRRSAGPKPAFSTASFK